MMVRSSDFTKRTGYIQHTTGGGGFGLQVEMKIPLDVYCHSRRSNGWGLSRRLGICVC